MLKSVNDSINYLASSETQLILFNSAVINARALVLVDSALPLFDF